MKRILMLLLCIIIVSGSICPSLAADNTKILYYGEERIDDSIFVTDTLYELIPVSRDADRSITRKKEYYSDGKLIGVIALTVVFRYDGNTVSVVSKEVTQCKTYEGWSFKQSALTSNGGTVSLSGKLKKNIFQSVSVAVSVTCDKNGNIT